MNGQTNHLLMSISLPQKNKLILADADGVLLDWSTAFHEWMAATHFTRTNYESYHCDEMYSLSSEQIKPLVAEFCSGDAIHSLPAMPGAVDAARQLHFAGGFRFVVITSVGNTPAVVRMRIDNLREHFGDIFETIKCLPCGSPKDHVLAKYAGSGLYWIEDSPVNADAGLGMGLKSILLAHSYNADYTGKAYRAKNWIDILEHISHDNH